MTIQSLEGLAPEERIAILQVAADSLLPAARPPRVHRKAAEQVLADVAQEFGCDRFEDIPEELLPKVQDRIRLEIQDAVLPGFDGEKIFERLANRSGHQVAWTESAIKLSSDSNERKNQNFGAVSNSLSGEETGKQRRSIQSTLGVMQILMDEIDYGVVLLEEDGEVSHVNHVARLELEDDSYPLGLTGNRIIGKRAKDDMILRDAVERSTRGIRSFLKFGEGARSAMISVLPLSSGANARRSGTIMLFARRQVGETLTIQAFARAHGMTASETRVLSALCNGVAIQEIARAHGVGVSTVRVHVVNIRAKTGAESIAALIRQVAVLPPMTENIRPS